MKDEIKEIIDRAKKLKYECECTEEIAPGKYIMRDDKQTDNLIVAIYLIDKLLDYITNLQERCEYLERSNNRREDEIMSLRDECVDGETYKSRNEKANALLDEMLERAYIDGKYIMYDYSTSELLEVKQALEGEDKDVNTTN